VRPSAGPNLARDDSFCCLDLRRRGEDAKVRFGIIAGVKGLCVHVRRSMVEFAREAAIVV
jgi:hypothetical protein